MLIIFLPIILIITFVKMVIFFIFEGFLYFSIPLRKNYTKQRIHDFHKKYPHLKITINFDETSIIQNIEIYYNNEFFHIDPHTKKDELKHILFTTKVKIADIESSWSKLFYNLQMWILDLPDNYIKI